jgi:TatD DNase family protein
MLVDSHCHLDRLDLTPYDNDFSRFMGETAKHQIEHLLCVAIDLESYPNMRALVDRYEDISVSVGVHPNEKNGREPTVEDLVKLADDPRVVAIGETGLDYYRSEGDLAWQQERFRHHIQAAKATGKPLIIHTREAREDTLQILAEEGADEVGGVVHCFTEDWETAKRALDLNFYISFSGIVTFKNAHAIQDAAKKVPEDRFLIETDSPYLAPMPHRGKPNYPFYVYHVADFLGKLRGVSLDAIAALSTRNFYSLFPVC